MSAVQFIAETDELGRIDWLWRRGPEDTISRPVHPSTAHLEELAEARVSGAPYEAAVQWLHRMIATH